jgi:hypothetical protein
MRILRARYKSPSVAIGVVDIQDGVQLVNVNGFISRWSRHPSGQICIQPRDAQSTAGSGVSPDGVPSLSSRRPLARLMLQGFIQFRNQEPMSLRRGRDSSSYSARVRDCGHSGFPW